VTDTFVRDRYIQAPDLSHGWVEAARLLTATPGSKLVHLIVRIADPTAENPDIRAAAQGLIDARNAVVTKELPDIDTTRNTVFPASWARRHPEPADLAEYYRDRYWGDDGLRAFNQNGRGTYFGRIVAYPRGDNESPADQLTDTVRKVRDEITSGSNKGSRYEINIYSERKDTSPMGFPCLAHLSVHLHHGQLHMQAVYRNEYLVGRAYGNYLGLAQLQVYMAEQAGTDVGELLMTIGHIELESGNKRNVLTMLNNLDT
jgi:hypothetical protein